MARRRRRKKKKNSKIAGLLCAAAILAAAGSAVFLTGFFEKGEGILKRAAETFEAVEETVGKAARQEVEFPELTVTVEEVEGDFYFQQLTEAEQTVYRELLQGVDTMEECIRLHAGKEDDVGKIYEYLFYDRPELFWCDGSSKMTVYEEYTEIYPGYTCDITERDIRREKIREAAKECLAGAEKAASDYEKIKYVYEYLVNNVDYNESAPDNQNIYSSLVLKNSVCAGYSRAAQYLLSEMGIECIYVTGEVEGQGAHAWNIVKCDDKYYQMDVTFGDPVFLEAESGTEIPHSSINYDYLCCTDEELFINHVQDDFVEYPSCVSDDLNYYKLNGMFYEEYDMSALSENMNGSVNAKENVFVCKFADREVYEEARDEVIEKLLPRTAKNLAARYGLDSVRYTYAEDKEHSKITVFWNYE